MKSIGTITKFYPFLEDETVSVIESIATKSFDYRDFIKNLLEYVGLQKQPEQAVYFAVIQAHCCFGTDDEIWQSTLPHCRKNTTLKPWSYWNNQDVAPWDEHRVEYQKAVKDALDTNPEKWILFHLYLISSWQAPELVETLAFLDRAKQLLEESPELECFAPYLLMIDSWFMDTKNDTETLLTHYNRMLQIAEENDDVYWIADSFRLKALALKDSKPNDALSFLEESYRLFNFLGGYANAGGIAGDMGTVFGVLGEYDAALEFLNEEVNISKKSLVPGRFRSSGVSTIVAGIYCDLDQPEQALEWINWHEESMQESPWTPSPALQSVLARTLIMFGRIDEGSEKLDQFHKQVLESGSDYLLAKFHLCQGFLEFQTGQINEALSTIEQALKESERLGSALLKNRCLLALAKAEISKITSGPWLDRLEEHARRNNYTGIRMQHALLKSEYQIKIGEHEDARLTLEDALTFTESLGVKTLRKRIQSKLDELT